MAANPCLSPSDYVGGFTTISPVVRRRREVTVDCLHNGTLTARGYGVATAWPDKGRLSFAFAAANRTRALVIGVNASDAIEGALAAAGFNAGGAPFGLPGLGPADGAAASVSLSPVKFALPTPEGDTVAKAAFLVEVRATLASGDPDQLEDGYSRALEAAVAAGFNGAFRAASAYYELSRARIRAGFEEAREAAVDDLVTTLVRAAADLGVTLGPLDAFAPERRAEIAADPDAGAAAELDAEGGGRPQRLFLLSELAADYVVCAGGFQENVGYKRIDEDVYDIVDLTDLRP